MRKYWPLVVLALLLYMCYAFVPISPLGTILTKEIRLFKERNRR